MKARRTLKQGGERPQAFWGALIGGLFALGSAMYSANRQSKLQREQIAEQNRLQQEANERNIAAQNANSLNNYAIATQGTENDDNYGLQYKKGGKRRLRNAGVITDGGYAIPLDDTTSLLQGSSHSQVNESGKTGIGINVGGKEIEAEGGEVVEKKGKDLRVFSAQPMLNGISPAQAVMQGADKDKVFKNQEYVKRRFRLRNGYSSPVRKQSKWGATFTTPDYIGLGTNIGASILSNIYANSVYNDLLKDVNYVLPEYTDEMFVAGPTKWRNAAQRAEVERTRLNGRRSIARNSASSNVGLGRMQELDTNAMYEANKLWDEKANKETELAQANAEREQAVRARNAQNRNQWLQKVADVQNQQLNTRLGIEQSKIDSNVGMIQGIGSSIGGFLQSGIDNYQAEQARRMHLAASPYGSAERMASMGVDFSTKEMRSLLNNAEDRLNRYKNDNTESGIKSYNDALDSYNFWNDRIGNTGYKKYSRRSLTRNTNPNPSLVYPLRPTQPTNTSGGHWDWFKGKWVSD